MGPPPTTAAERKLAPDLARGVMLLLIAMAYAGSSMPSGSTPSPTGGLLALQVLTGVLGGAGYAAAFGLLSLRLDARRGPVTRAVAAVGQRSLTFYLFSSVLVAAVLHRDPLGIGERVDSFGALTVAFTVWLVAVLLDAWMGCIGRAIRVAGQPRVAQRPWFIVTTRR